MNPHRLTFIVLLQIWLSPLFLIAGEIPQPAGTVEALIDTPLRDPAIGRGPDGVYYLTGTVATPGPDGRLDFANNDGVYLWKTNDLTRWRPLGKVWDLAADTRSRWNRMKGVNPDNPAGPPVRGVRAPEIHYLRGTFYIPYSMTHGGTGLLRSISGKAEGPYEQVGLMTVRGFDPSLFEDGDGTVYWVFGEGWIAAMNTDLTDLAEPPRLMRPQPADFPMRDQRNRPAFANTAPLIGTRGAFLFRENGRYHLAAGEYTERLGGKAVHDTFVASADSPDGPYGPRRLMIPHGGQTTVFRHESGHLYGTFGGDAMAVFQDRAGIVPLRYDGFLKQVWKPNLTSATNHPPAHPVHRAVVVEAGVVARLRPFPLDGPFESMLRDPTVLNAPDGWYYVVGTTAHSRMPDPRSPGIYGWRSRDFRHWEFVSELWNVRDWTGPGAPYTPQPPRFAPHLSQDFEGIWSPGIYYVKGNYYIVWGPAYGGSWQLSSPQHQRRGPRTLRKRSL